jgi:hypothetical protein
MEYKIISKDSKKIVNLSNLSRNLKVDSEILSIENSVETTLGLISHKALAYISVEAANYAFQNYSKKKESELRWKSGRNLEKARISMKRISMMFR